MGDDDDGGNDVQEGLGPLDRVLERGNIYNVHKYLRVQDMDKL